MSSKPKPLTVEQSRFYDVICAHMRRFGAVCIDRVEYAPDPEKYWFQEHLTTATVKALVARGLVEYSPTTQGIIRTTLPMQRLCQTRRVSSGWLAYETVDGVEVWRSAVYDQESHAVTAGCVREKRVADGTAAEGTPID